MSTLRVLAGDIGGTKTLLQLAEFSPGALRPQRLLREARYDSAAWDDLTPLLADFLKDDPRPHAACLAVAGPVQGDAARQSARLTNLPWQLDSQRLGAGLGLPAVRLINDFEAVGYGIEALAADELVPLHARPARPDAPRLVLGAGTGLGVALLMPCGGGYQVFPTEAGHMDFAPGDALQDGLLAFLRAEHGHVSWERLVSGPGLVNIYRYLCQRADAEPALLAAVDPAAAIAGSGDDPRAAAALQLFIRLYGAIAGNLALACLARGGVYLAGGIATKILPHLQQGGFAHSYCDKGRMRAVVEAIPVQVVTNPQVGLLGALLLAARSAPNQARPE